MSSYTRNKELNTIPCGFKITYNKMRNFDGKPYQEVTVKGSDEGFITINLTEENLTELLTDLKK